MFPLPTAVFLTRGVGFHRHKLTAFEYALREADIEQQNLVYASSILLPGIALLPTEIGVATLRPGEITFCVMARAETSEPGRRIAASIGMARPKNPTAYGYISEHHGFGMTERESGEYAEDLAASMRASTLGVEFDPGAAWNDRRQIYEMSDVIVDSLSLTAGAEGALNGDWTCAVAAAVFRFSPTLIHFDAHVDTWPDNFGQAYAHGSVFYHAVEERLVDPRRMIQVGIRSPVQREVYDWTLERE